MEVLIISKQPEKWATKICKECGEEFEVYKKDVERGKGKFCSLSCSTTYRNKHNNYAKKEKVREKISKNHADVSGGNNPMHNIKLTGESNPSYKDGRSKYSEYYRFIAFENKPHKCEICDKKGKPKDFHVHHKDKNNNNNNLSNLMVVCPKCHNLKCHEVIRDKKGRFKEVVGNAR